jgi:hypothetical protein
MAEASQADLPEWLVFHALPVGPFAMVALSNLTPQNNDLRISSAVYINETAPQAQNGLPEYHRYMAITKSEKFKGARTILKDRPGRGGNPGNTLLVLVQRQDSSDLAGCFLFGIPPSSRSQNAPAPASSRGKSKDSFAVRLLLQRVYPSTGVEASDWYHCLYAALFRLLYKGSSLPLHLLSVGLLPDIRMAPDKVTSLPLYCCF